MNHDLVHGLRRHVPTSADAARTLDGKFAICFTVRGFIGAGAILVEEGRVTGGDDLYMLAGIITGSCKQTRGQLHVSIDERVFKNAHMTCQFSFDCAGTSTGSSFALIGTGPLGVIIEFTGQRAG